MKEVKAKGTMLDQIRSAVHDDLMKENKAKWVAELKHKTMALTKAKNLVRNCERDIEDLEMRINEELS